LDVVECGVGAIVWRHEATARRLVSAVLAASRGDGDLPADLLGSLLNQVGTLHRGAAGQQGGPSLGLTPREVDVVRLIAEGLDTGEIAGKLSYSERTVKNVIHGVTTRLHLRNRAHAVAYALREGYI
ncbi:LuxR C-terminal-related transcriptional regulator, partial [Streptomyces sp. KAI-27]|nr:response regulator transcription factor [Streptomyces sp. KAI-27]